MTTFAAALTPAFVRNLLPFVLIALTVLSNPSPGLGGSDPFPELPENSGALLTDPVFTPSNLTSAFHMTPVILYGGDILRPGEFDFDFVLGSFGTDFSQAEKQILLEEDTDVSFYTDLGWRFGLAERIGPLRIPSEFFTQIPFYFPNGDFESALLGEEGFDPVGKVDEDFALGKWVAGLRLGLLSETSYRPSLVLSGSVGFPVDDSLASDGTDFDLRLSTEKHFRYGLRGTAYAGFLFPGDGQEAVTDLGVDSEGSVPYFGLLTSANVAQFCGHSAPGRTWLHFGGSWRDALYDFGALGPDYAEEETKLTGGVTFDLGWWGCRLGRPQAMLGANYMLFGGPEEGETEFLVRLRFPYRFGRTWPCEEM